MWHGFEIMCIVYERLSSMVCFFIYAFMYILLYKCRYTYYTLFLCLYMENEDAEHKKQLDQETIRFNNQSTITPTTNEEMRHACNSSNGKISSNEWQLI